MEYPRRPGWHLRLAVVLAVFLFAPVASTQAPSEDIAEFSYRLGNDLFGNIQGRCEAVALQFDPSPPATIRVEAATASLEVVDVWVNRSTLSPGTLTPVDTRLDSGHSVQRYRLAPGPLAVEAAGGGRMLALPVEGFAAGGTPFSIAYNATRAHAGPARLGQPLGGFWTFDEAGEYEILSTASGWSRALEMVGQDLDVRGSFVLYLEEASIIDSERRIELPAYATTTGSTLGALSVQSDHFQYGLLRVDGARATVAWQTARPVCRALSYTVDGTLTAYNATGSFQPADAPREAAFPFGPVELTLRGNFAVEEAAARDSSDGWAPVPAVARGRFEAVGLDFDFGIVSPSPLRLAGPVAASLLAALTGLVLFKLLGPLYVRLRDEQVLGHGERRRIFDAIGVSPAMDAEEVAAMVGMKASAVRYHCDILVRHGLVQRFTLGRRVHYLADHHDADSTRRRVLMETDEVVRDLVGRLGGHPCAGDVVAQMSQTWGLSRSGGWKVVDRAHRAGLITKQRRGRKVFLRPAL